MIQNLRGSGKNSRAAATLTTIRNPRAPFSEANLLTSWHRLVFYWHDHNLRQNPNTKSQTWAKQQSANTTRCWTNWARRATLDLIQNWSYPFLHFFLAPPRAQRVRMSMCLSACPAQTYLIKSSRLKSSSCSRSLSPFQSCSLKSGQPWSFIQHWLTQS